jgi:hypothetical protein
MDYTLSLFQAVTVAPIKLPDTMTLEDFYRHFDYYWENGQCRVFIEGRKLAQVFYHRSSGWGVEFADDPDKTFVPENNLTEVTIIWQTDMPQRTMGTWVEVYRETRKNYVASRAKNLSTQAPTALLKLTADRFYTNNAPDTFYQNGQVVETPSETVLANNAVATVGVYWLDLTRNLNEFSAEYGVTAGRWDDTYGTGEYIIGFNNILSAQYAFNALSKGRKYRGVVLGDSKQVAVAYDLGTGIEEGLIALYHDGKVIDHDAAQKLISDAYQSAILRSTWLSQDMLLGLNKLNYRALQASTTVAVRDHVQALRKDVITMRQALTEKGGKHALERARLQTVIDGLEKLEALYD